MKRLFAVSLIACATFAPAAFAQSQPSAGWEVGAGYNYVHTNAPPAACGCFSMNGGVASVARQFTPRFGVEAEVNGVYNANVNATGQSLTLYTYVAGPRYRFTPTRRVGPYAQVLVGASHASGGLYGTATSATGTANAFATSLGGGIDLAISKHVALRLIQADYLLTLLPNNVNSRQNNVSLSTGFVIRFAAK